MAVVYLGLGSNLGDRAWNLAQAAARLGRNGKVAVRARSSIWESTAIGPEQPDYLNAALAVETDLEPAQLLAECKAIERELGRKPGPRWGPRPVDIDLLLCDCIVAEPALQVPHLELHRRAFALLPLCELAPDAVHPVLQRPLGELLAELGDQGVRRYGSFA